MTGDVPYWPDGFLDELLALAEASASAGTELDPAALAEMYERAAEEQTREELDNPSRALGQMRGDRAAFEARLVARWGRALDLFDLTVESAFDVGRWVNSGWRGRAAATQDQKFEALVRLHGRAVMTANEVQVLLRSGYSTGALARWRTAHEIWVVFSILSVQGQELSRRYLVHEAVESMRGQEDYESAWEALGFEPPESNPAERDELRAKLANEFGRAFLRDYGWAAPLFGDRAPKFKEIQELAELDHWKGHYRMASHGTHANPKGISWSIQEMTETRLILAGPSNSGLVDPGQCTLIALANLTIGLLRYAVQELMADDELEEQCIAIVRQQAILVLMDHAIQAFATVHDQQEAEEEVLCELIEQAKAVLAERPRLDVGQLAKDLAADPDELHDAVEAGVRRGILSVDRQYLVAGSAEDDQSPNASTNASDTSSADCG